MFFRMIEQNIKPKYKLSVTTMAAFMVFFNFHITKLFDFKIIYTLEFSI